MSDETNEVTQDETSDVMATEPSTVETDVLATEPSDVETDVLDVEPSAVETDVMHASASDPVDDGRTNPRKIREGVVISDKMNSTLVVAVHERVRHPRYDKTVQRTKKLYVHDEKNEAKIGDKVRVQETRPLSKLKRWRLTEIVERAR
jgi:small subunit ribosomal protein S17